jgi:hypothetical protein
MEFSVIKQAKIVKNTIQEQNYAHNVISDHIWKKEFAIEASEKINLIDLISLFYFLIFTFYFF